MPLKSGKSRDIIEENIEELISSGYTRKQAVAIALDRAGLSKVDKGRLKEKASKREQRYD